MEVDVCAVSVKKFVSIYIGVFVRVASLPLHADQLQIASKVPRV